MKIILIAAMAANRVIGRGSEIPWHIPGEQARFKEITMGHALVMGRKTFEAIGRPLPGRRTIVITRDQHYTAPGCLVCHDLAAALDLANEDDTVFIAGGGQIYELALPLADGIILTTLHRDIEGDILFPEFSLAEFPETRRETVAGPEPYTMTWHQRSS